VHLLFPLFSSVTFVLGMLFGRQAILGGASPWTGTVLSNLWLAAVWLVAGCWHGDWLPLAAWWQAALVGFAFLAGQFFTFAAFQFGDVSVATPVLGIKVLIVAFLVTVFAGEPVTIRVWIASGLAAAGVILVQSTAHAGQGSTRRRALATLALALAAATSLSLFDIGLQVWGRSWGAGRFLPVTFIAAGVLSCGLLPWTDSAARLRTRGVLRPVIIGTVLIALQAVSMSWSLAGWGDATRINIVYALRGLWSVLIAWSLARWFGTGEAGVPSPVMLRRLFGAALLTVSVFLALL
jgi:drug/metabolite transporter (DMT)-like permease